MKILVVSQYFYPEPFRINSLCQELVLRGHEVTVLTGFPNYPQGKIYNGYGIKKEYEKTWKGVHIERVPIIPRGTSKLHLLLNCLSYVISGRKWARKCRQSYDICYVFEVSPVTVALPAIKFKKKHGTPILFNVQDLWPENVEVVLGVKNKAILWTLNKLVDYIYNNSDHILCASNSFVDNIHKRGISKDKLLYWPQYCNMPNEVKNEYPVIFDKSTFNLVFTGNIGEAQGLDIVLDAAELIPKSKKIKWYIIGDGRAKARLMEETIKRGLTESVIFVDRLPEEEIFSYILNCDCALLTLMKNKVFDMTIPAKLQTYMMCKVPILAACSGEVASIIESTECGKTVSPGDGKMLAKSAEWMAQLPVPLRKEMGDKSYKYYLNNYEKNLLINELESLMKKYSN